MSNGKKFKQLVASSKPLQIVGTVNAYSAVVAEKVDHRSIYLSGGGVVACSLGVPDLAISTLHDVLEDARRITNVSSLPLLVDVDTGWGGVFNIARCVKDMTKSGVAAIHIEDVEKTKDKLKTCGQVYADSAYANKKNDEKLGKQNNKVLHRAYRNKPLTKQQKQQNKQRSSIRYIVERTFGDHCINPAQFIPLKGALNRVKRIKQHLFYPKIRQITSYSSYFWVKNALFSAFPKSHWV